MNTQSEDLSLFRSKLFSKPYYRIFMKEVLLTELSDAEICTEIVQQTKRMMGFWSNCGGWGSSDVSHILGKAMLDWQISLADTLHLWLQRQSIGELILAWVNLGTLVEGLLKLFLCVYYEDYKKDEAAERKKGELVIPSELMMEKARRFMKKIGIWEQECDWDLWIGHIQKRRNAIHAFKPCEEGIGSFNEWKKDIRVYLYFQKNIDDRLPYP